MPVKVYDGTNWVTVAGDGQAGAPGDPGTPSSISTWVKTASGGETSVSGTGDTGYGTLAYTVGQELVYLNGVLLDRGDDYTATNGTSITGLTALTANDVVTVWTVNSFSVANTYTQAQSDARYPAKAGSVLQVVQGTTSTATTTTSTSYVASNLSVTITPSSSTSKILVMYSMCNLANRSGTYQDYQLALYRGGTQVWVTGNSNFGDVPSAVYAMNFDSGNYLDSPATTSATTYTMYGKRTVGTLTMNEQGVANQGTLIAMEIGA